MGGNDRKLKFFDLQNPVPIEVSSSYLKSRITAGAWPIHWTIILTLVDDAYAISESLIYEFQQSLIVNYCFSFCLVDAGGVVVRQPIDIGIKAPPAPLFQSSGYSCDISFSDWLNMYLYVNEHGDIHGSYPSQMLASFLDSRRLYRTV